jgi:hypothetical protein
MLSPNSGHSQLSETQIRHSKVHKFRASCHPALLNFVRWRLIFVGPSKWNLIRVTLLAPRILRCLLDFWKIVDSCSNPLWGATRHDVHSRTPCKWRQQVLLKRWSLTINIPETSTFTATATPHFTYIFYFTGSKSVAVWTYPLTYTYPLPRLRMRGALLLYLHHIFIAPCLSTKRTFS